MSNEVQIILKCIQFDFYYNCVVFGNVRLMIKRENNWRSFFLNKPEELKFKFTVEKGNAMHLQYISHRICKNLLL